MGVSFWQIAIIVFVVILLFGAGKIPRLMKDMGLGIKAFKQGLNEEEHKKLSSKEEEQQK